MTYSLKDVDAAEALVRQIRPGTLVQRGDYDYSLSIADKEMKYPGVILFRPRRHENGQSEITTSPDEIRDICFILGSQWTEEQLTEIKAKRKASKP